MELVKTDRKPLALDFETLDNCLIRIKENKKSSPQDLGELELVHIQPKTPIMDFISSCTIENTIAWSVFGILAFFVLFAPFDVPRMSTIGIGVLILICCIGYVIAESDKNIQIALGIFAGITVLLYLVLPKSAFANIVAYLIFIPITIAVFHHFAAVASTPIALISPAGGFMGYLALQVFVVLAMILLLSYFDGGLFIRAFVRDVMYLFHWDWIARILDTDGDYTNPFYRDGKGFIMSVIDRLNGEAYVKAHLGPEWAADRAFSKTKEWYELQLQNCIDNNKYINAAGTPSRCETEREWLDNWVWYSQH